MSNISANIVVESNPINVVVGAPGPINVGVDPINLNVSTGSFAVPGGNAGELQFNDGIFQGVPNVTWDGNALNLGTVSNVKIYGGTNNYVLKTDGTGNLSWSDSVISANTAVTVTGNAQPNITSLGTLSNLTVNGQANLGNVANLTITGGTNGYVLQTDGTGNLSWVVQTGGGGNGTPGGANTQIQYNDEGLFGGNVGFTFNETTGDVNIPGTVNADGFGLSNIVGANVTGSVANATFADSAGTVTTNAQPNITSLGTLSNLNVQGTTSIQQAIEKVTTNTSAQTGTINYDLLDQAILNATANATGNITVNFRGNSTTSLDTVMPSNSSMTCTFINQNGATPYAVSNVTIDGSSTTVYLPTPGTQTEGTPNGKDIYHFNIIKTASSQFTVYVTALGYV